MGAITRGVANGITTSGVVLKSIINNDSFDNVTALPSSFGDGITFISSQTASASASISFTSGLTSTYKAYKFVFVNMHPATDDIQFQFNMSTDGGSNYNVTKTSTFFSAVHGEGGAGGTVSYQTTLDLAQSTGFQEIGYAGGNDNDQNLAGTLTLFNPASTTYVKHFISTSNNISSGDFTVNNFSAGYGNTTSAINAIQFKMSSGNIDAGTIYMYGIK
jgi:hypothetical protein